MKSPTLIVPCICVAISLAVGPAYAQRGGIQANIPFNFAVSGKTFPAGEYTMTIASHQVRIGDAKGRLIAILLANNISGRSAGKNGRIILHCYSERCFLSELWSPAQENGRQLPISRAKAELAREEREKYFAVLGEGQRRAK